jgi:hypothetical protein
MTPQELRNAAIQKRREEVLKVWEGKVKPQSPPCETCGEAKKGKTPKVIKNG